MINSGLFLKRAGAFQNALRALTSFNTTTGSNRIVNITTVGVIDCLVGDEFFWSLSGSNLTTGTMSTANQPYDTNYGCIKLDF